MLTYDSGASHLTKADWELVVNALSPAMAEIKTISNEVGLNSTLSKVWPSIEIKNKELRKKSVLRLSLNSKFLEDGDLFFELVHCSFSNRGFFQAPTGHAETLAIYKPESFSDKKQFTCDLKRHISAHLE